MAVPVLCTPLASRLNVRQELGAILLDGVLKLTTESGSTYDFNIPRREWKVGIGHTGFAVELDPEINPKEAASRRDYTINALTYDPRAQEILDFFDGRRDLENRVLRHTSKAFEEDPLRVLRGMQFAALVSQEAPLCASVIATAPCLGAHQRAPAEQNDEAPLRERRTICTALRFLVCGIRGRLAIPACAH
jgi:hypothetical protein